MSDGTGNLGITSDLMERRHNINSNRRKFQKQHNNAELRNAYFKAIRAYRKVSHMQRKIYKQQSLAITG